MTHADENQASWQKVSNHRTKLIPYFGDFSSLELLGERRRQQLFQGFNSIYSFLHTSQTRFGVVQEHKPQHQDWLIIPDYNLVTLEENNNSISGKQAFHPDEKSNIQTLSATNNEDTEDRSSLGFEGASCFTSHTNLEGFYITETHTILKIGQIIAFSSPEEPVQIGSIR